MPFIPDSRSVVLILFFSTPPAYEESHFHVTGSSSYSYIHAPVDTGSKLQKYVPENLHRKWEMSKFCIKMLTATTSRLSLGWKYKLIFELLENLHFSKSRFVRQQRTAAHEFLLWTRINLHTRGPLRSASKMQLHTSKKRVNLVERGISIVARPLY